jgi:hypothetical protein
VDRLRSGQAATVDKAVDTVYAESFDELINTLDDKYQSADPDALSPSSGATFFLTVATGFWEPTLSRRSWAERTPSSSRTFVEPRDLTLPRIV